MSKSTARRKAIQTKAPSKRKTKAAAVLEWAKSTRPNPYGRECALHMHEEAAGVVRELCEMRHRGESTPSIRQVAERLLEEYPELAARGPFGFVQLRDYIGRHIKGGWGGRV